MQPPASLNMQQAAKRAAAAVEVLILEMLMANEFGEVAVVVGYAELSPEKRPIDKRRAIKVARGRESGIEVS